MDAKQLGTFIAQRRRELGMTQALLAKRLNITDKAVSRWERGIGFPDLSNMEALAGALELSLMELMRAQRNEQDSISTQEAEKLLIDTIRLTKSGTRLRKTLGILLLSFFAAFGAVALCVLFSDWDAVIFSVGSILTGLAAWGIPIWRLTVSRAPVSPGPAVASFTFALSSLLIQFLDIAKEVQTGDLRAIEDTAGGLVIVVTVFISVTVLLNLAMAKAPKHR